MNDNFRKRPKNKKFTHIESSLRSIVDPLTHDDGIFKEICFLWSQIGEDVNANSEPVSIKNNVVTVKISSSPWMQQLQFMKSEILDNLNARLGDEIIKDIRFRLG
ncbi:MAG: DciA family protein [Thermodesulfobacteriota bacterium]